MNEINQGQILLPVMALVGLTFIVLLQIPYRRFKAGFNGLVTGDDFKLGESKRVPDYVVLANRNFMNLLELPVLFYFICILFYILEAVEIKVLVLAWGYVLLRFLHSGIHLSYNNISHRLIAFALSNVVLVIMWIFLLRPIFMIADISA
jgi:hypothetical protein